MLGKIEEIFRGRKADIMGSFRKSAVMILILEEEGREYIIFEVRSEKLNHQPGDICLPGGKIEAIETPREAAIRETMEELNLDMKDIDLIGEMDYFISPYGSIMYPFVSKLRKKNFKPNEAEVDHIIKVPIEYFLEKEPLLFEMEIGPRLTEDFPFHLIRGGKDYKFSKGKLNQYFYVYENYVIWGFTAMIIKNFIDLLKNHSN